MTVAGWWHGHEVVAKRLTTNRPYWRKRFAHEVSAYRVFASCPPTWRVPEPYHAGETVLVVERLPGATPHAERYPPLLPAATVAGMIEALTLFAAWRPPPGPLGLPATDWAARARRYVASGDLPAEDRDGLLAAIAAAPAEFGHGDPLPSNALCAAGRPVTFIDYEFAGLYPAGADLALLGVWLGRHDPAAEQRCAEAATAAGHRPAYRAMRVLWLAREQRLHPDVFTGAGADDVRGWLSAQVTVAMSRGRGRQKGRGSGGGGATGGEGSGQVR
ncbi:phosphotransferase [Actinoplanes sp. CA-142083]|uniref:phosphotransferase n=1 Tax=Actinoplanes sp. CA-142083 TaxID=3239903 RepID=UPI003D91488B